MLAVRHGTKLVAVVVAVGSLVQLPVSAGQIVSVTAGVGGREGSDTSDGAPVFPAGSARYCTSSGSKDGIAGGNSTLSVGGSAPYSATGGQGGVGTYGKNDGGVSGVGGNPNGNPGAPVEHGQYKYCMVQGGDSPDGTYGAGGASRGSTWTAYCASRAGWGNFATWYCPASGNPGAVSFTYTAAPASCSNGANNPPTCSILTINASSGTGGTISPAGAVSVPYGNNKTFTIAASSGYTISSVTVDGVSRGVINTYTFSSVTAAHTIAAAFVVNSPPVTASPDLISGATSPASARAGTSQTFGATIANQGNASTGSSFYDIIQVATAANGGGTITTLGAVSMSALAAGASKTTSQSYTFPSIGTYSMRACADKSSATDTGTVSESNENNNCGAQWTAVNVTATPPASCPNGANNPPTCNTCSSSKVWNGSSCVAAPPAPTATLTASPSAIINGQSTTLTWHSTNAPSCTAVGGFSTGGTKNGSVSVSPTNTATYGVTCGGTTDTATVNVLQPTTNISAAPTLVRRNDTTTITWSSTYTTGCVVSGPGLNLTSLNGSESVTIKAQSTFTITCNGASSKTTVNVLPSFQEI